MNVQVLFAATEPDARVMVFGALRVRLFVPPQTDCVPLVTVRPVGKTSVNARPVRFTLPGTEALVLSIVNVSVEVAFFAIGSGLNVLEKSG